MVRSWFRGRKGVVQSLGSRFDDVKRVRVWDGKWEFSGLMRFLTLSLGFGGPSASIDWKNASKRSESLRVLFSTALILYSTHYA